jgi:hypothetical protein
LFTTFLTFTRFFWMLTAHPLLLKVMLRVSGVYYGSTSLLCTKLVA